MRIDHTREFPQIGKALLGAETFVDRAITQVGKEIFTSIETKMRPYVEESIDYVMLRVSAQRNRTISEMGYKLAAQKPEATSHKVDAAIAKFLAPLNEKANVAISKAIRAKMNAIVVGNALQSAHIKVCEVQDDLEIAQAKAQAIKNIAGPLSSRALEAEEVARRIALVVEEATHNLNTIKHKFELLNEWSEFTNKEVEAIESDTRAGAIFAATTAT